MLCIYSFIQSRLTFIYPIHLGVVYHRFPIIQRLNKSSLHCMQYKTKISRSGYSKMNFK